jgi:histidine triad (HIT) family protein
MTIKSLIAKKLFGFSKKPFVGTIIGFSLKSLYSIIPVNKVYKTKHAVSFYHPKPIQEGHILIIPKKHVRSFIEIKENELIYLLDCLTIANVISQESHLNHNYLLCTNGGPRQEVKQLHFHFLREFQINQVNIQDFHLGKNEIKAIEHPQKNWEFHMILLPAIKFSQKGLTYSKELIDSIHRVIQEVNVLVKEYHLNEKGFTVYILPRKDNYLEFHLGAGKRI